MILTSNNDPTQIFDKHYSLKCPHCLVQSNVTAISIPRYEFLARFQPEKIGIVYRCDSCNEPIFLRFSINNYELGNLRIMISETYEEIERPMEVFELQYLPSEVERDFREALTCYSVCCFNAFGAMCRRTVQSASNELGAKGKDKVLRQLKDLKAMAEIDDETFKVLEQIIIAGHDGAHPHLPELSSERAEILMELMKDVLYQLFVRKQKIQEAVESRQKARGQAGSADKD